MVSLHSVAYLQLVISGLQNSEPGLVEKSGPLAAQSKGDKDDIHTSEMPFRPRDTHPAALPPNPEHGARPEQGIP